MSRFMSSVRQFVRSEDGPTSVEYCFMLGFIVLVCIVGITSLGETTHSLYQRSYDTIVTADSASGV